MRARDILADSLEKGARTRGSAARAEAEKIRKQKAGRPRSIKRQILMDKLRNTS